jgi:hypothetical protein
MFGFVSSAVIALVAFVFAGWFMFGSRPNRRRSAGCVAFGIGAAIFAVMRATDLWSS